MWGGSKQIGETVSYPGGRCGTTSASGGPGFPGFPACDQCGKGSRVSNEMDWNIVSCSQNILGRELFLAWASWTKEVTKYRIVYPCGDFCADIRWLRPGRYYVIMLDARLAEMICREPIMCFAIMALRVATSSTDTLNLDISRSPVSSHI